LITEPGYRSDGLVHRLLPDPRPAFSSTGQIEADPDTLQLEEGFSRDVRSIGHYGTGDLEVRIKNAADFVKAQPLI